MASSSTGLQTAAFGLLVVAAVVGNSVLSVSSPSKRMPIASAFPSSHMQAEAPAHSSVDVDPVRVEDEVAGIAVDGPSLRAAGIVEGVTEPDSVIPEDAQVVPAIYAWDPGVRLVFHRSVGKWM